jgi:hypothetical protein
MTISANSPSHPDRSCAIKRTGQFGHSQLHITFSSRFCRALHVIDSSYEAPHPFKSPVSYFSGPPFDPSQPLTELQCP